MTSIGDPPSLIRADELRERLQISESVLRKWLADGTIPRHTYVCVGHVYRYDYSKVYAALFGEAVDSGMTQRQAVQLRLPLGDDNETNN
jgi:predicted DNA-binding transcriptional regulator AlpA